MPPSNAKILVIRGGAIGDFILTLPAIAALRKAFPQAALHIIGYPHVASLAVAGGLANEVRSIESRAMAGFFADRGDLDPDLAAYFAEFAVIVSYLYDPDQIFRTNVQRCSKAQFIAGPHRPEEGANLHAAEAFLQPLNRLAIFDADPAPRLDLGKAGAAELGPGKWLAVHPGSGSERKNWPEARWAEFLAELAQISAWNLLLVGGEAEGERLDRLGRRLPEGRRRLARNLALPELGRRLRECHFFIGHDSGITHLAGAVGLTGLVLWGESKPEVWRPLNPGLRLLRAPDGLSELKVSEVFAQISNLNLRSEI